MVFSSPIFLFFFLPFVLCLYPVFPNIRAKNLWLLLVSCIFYAWGEPVFIFLILGSTSVNYLFGLWLEAESSASGRKKIIALAIIFNVGLLAFFKYTNFVVENVNWIRTGMHLQPVHPKSVRLPVGISFFTFHAISYVMDIYRRNRAAARQIENVALYIFFFPQLIAGPILRWRDMALQISERIHTTARFSEGVRRFIYGLAKKILIANTLALPASQIFSMPAAGLSCLLAWLGSICYALQIYYDFSGYSDMAVGLGKMFGFDFMENFNYPYISLSIREFWHRWHISLSTWFRDYVYFPMGGSRCSRGRNHLNLLLVFFLCGLWHGANWTFVIWGFYHGLFLILERTAFGKMISSLPKVLSWAYASLVVLVGWVVFRAETFPQALEYLSAMFGGKSARFDENMFDMLFPQQNEIYLALLAGVVFAAPLLGWLRRELLRLLQKRVFDAVEIAGLFLEPLALIILMIGSCIALAQGTYNPFIYFRF